VYRRPLRRNSELLLDLVELGDRACCGGWPYEPENREALAADAIVGKLRARTYDTVFADATGLQALMAEWQDPLTFEQIRRGDCEDLPRTPQASGPAEPVSAD
jgi:hypothetical protein